MPEPTPLRDNEFIYIAIRNLSLMDLVTGEITPNAYYLREHDIEGPPPHGLSTTVLDHCPGIEEIKSLTGLKSKVRGVDALNVGETRRTGLEVVRMSATKALIVGMPYPAADDYEAAERRNILADKLATISRRMVRL